MPGFDIHAYGPVIGGLLTEDRVSALGPGQPNTAARDKLDALSVDRAFAHVSVRDRDMATTCLSGLWLVHDYLDDAHTICQSVETPTGSYWHGILHRREPDYSNSKYWFRRVGTHPIFGRLRDETAELAAETATDSDAAFLTTQTAWDPFAFVDLCEQAASGRSAHESLCRQIQRREWELLLDYSYTQAVG